MGGGGGDNDDDNDDSNVQHTTNGRRVVAIDQGTTSTRCIAYRMSDDCCDVIPVKSAQLTHEQIHPKPGWVEHDPEEILERVANCYEDVAGETEQSLTTVGITNQRETIVAWDSETQKPLHNAIVWCDVRTAEIVSRFSEKEKQLVLEKNRNANIDVLFRDENAVVARKFEGCSTGCGARHVAIWDHR